MTDRGVPATEGSHSSDQHVGVFFVLFFLNTDCYVLFPLSVKNILFPREAKQKAKQGNEMEKRRRMNTQWQQEAYVLLPNGTFIWLVTFFCSRMVYCRQSLFVRKTVVGTFRPHILLILCDFLYAVLFSWLYDFLFVSRIIFTHSPSVLCFFCMCVQISVAGCSCLASSFITLSLASQSLKWADWNKHMN